jgi:CMP-N-acetylneuraminic acid synthetase/spore coat polysaccharide biosynthesis predicted glycosyltransferase SpsG
MKTICVIPARGNSNGVTKKNLRLLDGKPLLWYSIQNGKKVSDTVIVSSEDDEILEYAKFQGVTAHKRPTTLSQDVTTIDSVIVDAVKNLNCHYVVTLQPTSPTLKAETVLKALEDIYMKDLDWMTSVVDDTHIHYVDGFTWERVNRQYMAKTYKETGGFQICRRSTLDSGSRFTGKGGFFEISSDEAIDIDTEQDFLLVDTILNKLNIKIVYSESHEIGTGHRKRSELLKSLLTGHNIEIIEYSKDIILNDEDIVILDILNIDKNPVKYNQNKNTFIVTLENLGDFRGDLNINGIYSSGSIHSGWKYMNLNDHLILKDCFKLDGKVIVCFGGTDVNNLTQQYSDSGYKVYHPGNPTKIDWNDTKCVITGAGNVAYEATARRLPVLCIPQNEREKLHEVLTFDNVMDGTKFSPENVRLNDLHRASFKYDFSGNNERVKDLIITEFRKFQLARKEDK